jgi:hypothetical protein
LRRKKQDWGKIIIEITMKGLMVKNSYMTSIFIFNRLIGGLNINIINNNFIYEMVKATIPAPVPATGGGGTTI